MLVWFNLGVKPIIRLVEIFIHYTGVMDPDITQESKSRPTEKIPIQEIQRLFNIDPETNKVETPKPKNSRRNSCMY
jgi:hypothetical protein